jgi:NRAMP (natural resistance-associated macrophage protein)-like metal ion transporter
MTAPIPKTPLRNFIRKLGPGVITGAADDDPSGIATYSMAGAQFGTSLLWMAWVTWPLMAVVQMMCARIGMVTGQGLAGALSEKFPRPVMVLVCIALLGANTINIGADLSGMADAAEMLTGLSSHIFVVLFGASISLGIIRFRYHEIANVLKWLVITLFAYIITAFIVHPDWGIIAHDTFLPPFPRSKDSWSMIVAILGTTISPYLFFWQASQEVEEEKAMGRRMLSAREGATSKELNDRVLDVGVGTFFSNSVMFFIILTTALTLHAHGITSIASSKEAAAALKPLAGNMAMFLFTTGIIGVGLLAIPTLSGSAAYAFSEARAFYAIIILSTLCGIMLDYLDINPLQALYWTAIINGILAPFLLIGILLVARDKRIMLGQPSSTFSQLVVLLTTILMFCAALAMFVL